MCEMMKIMQENREVTCCLGSSANFRNSRLFLQSDFRYRGGRIISFSGAEPAWTADKSSISWLHSIGLDPLYPSQCSWETFGYATGGGLHGDAEGLSPLRLSGQLNSLGCSVSFHQGNSVSLIKLIEQVGPVSAPGATGADLQLIFILNLFQARHTTSGIRKCFLFLLQCQLSLVIVQVRR